MYYDDPKINKQMSICMIGICFAFFIIFGTLIYSYANRSNHGQTYVKIEAGGKTIYLEPKAEENNVEKINN